MVGMALSPCHYRHNPGGLASGGSHKASLWAPLRDFSAKAGGCRDGTRHPISRSCNSSSPPLNLLEELVWKFQPIFKGYFHSSEIYQRRRVIFTAHSNCQLPWQRAGRNAIKHPSVIVNTKGTTGTEKKDDCCGGEEGNTVVRSPRPGTYLGSGSYVWGDFVGSSVPMWGQGSQKE